VLTVAEHRAQQPSPTTATTIWAERIRQELFPDRSRYRVESVRGGDRVEVHVLSPNNTQEALDTLRSELPALLLRSMPSVEGERKVRVEGHLAMCPRDVICIELRRGDSWWQRWTWEHRRNFPWQLVLGTSVALLLLFSLLLYLHWRNYREPWQNLVPSRFSTWKG